MIRRSIHVRLVYGVLEWLSRDEIRRTVRSAKKIVKKTIPYPLGLGAISSFLLYPDLEFHITWASGLLVTVVLFFLGKDVYTLLRLRAARRRLLDRRGNDQASLCSWKEYPVDATFRHTVDGARKGSDELVLASIGMSGRAYSPFGEIPYLPSVSKERISIRDRYDIDIVLAGDYVYLRKDYRGDRLACLREFFNMESMRVISRVPSVRRLDETGTVLYMDYVCGRTMLEILRDARALMRDSDVENDREFVGLEEDERQRKLDDRAKEKVTHCFSRTFFERLDELILRVHDCRISDLDIRYANFIVDDTGTPWMVDFTDSKFFPPWLAWVFRFKCEGDRFNYQRLFRRSLPPEPHLQIH